MIAVEAGQKQKIPVYANSFAFCNRAELGLAKCLRNVLIFPLDIKVAK